jgi:biofilm PGA synthesis N-glycosyltransferase PgaC
LFFTHFLGYGVLLYALVRIRRIFKGKRVAPSLDQDFPTLTLIIAAYNEESIIEEKIANTLSLSYPKEKLKLIFVTDGSSDSTPDLISKYSEIKLMHTPLKGAGKFWRCIAQCMRSTVMWSFIQMPTHF